MSHGRREGWTTGTGGGPKRSVPLLQPLQATPVLHTPQTTTTAAAASSTTEGPLLPYLVGAPQWHAGSGSARRAAGGVGGQQHGKKTREQLAVAALAQTPSGSQTYQAISQLYTVYNIAAGASLPAANGKGGKRQPGRSNKQPGARAQQLQPQPYAYAAPTTGADGADASSSPFGASSMGALPPGSFPMGPMGDTYGGHQQQQYQAAFGTTLQHGTNLPIPSGTQGYEQALWYQQQYAQQQQQQQELDFVPSSQSSSSLTPQPPPAQIKSSGSVPRFRGAGGASAKQSTSNLHAAAAKQPSQQDDRDEKVNADVVISPAVRIQPLDDSNDTIVVYDRTHASEATSPHASFQHPNDSLHHPHHPPPPHAGMSSEKYSIADAPTFTKSLGHLHSTAGEELSGSGGTAALPVDPEVASSGADEKSSITAAAAAADGGSTSATATLDPHPNAWKDVVYAFLTNPEHQRRLLKFDLHAPQRRTAPTTTTADRYPRDPLAQDADSSFSYEQHFPRLHRSDLSDFSSVQSDALLYFRAFMADGRSFSSVGELAKATEYAHQEWARRRAAAYKLGLVDVADEQVQRLLDHLKRPDTRLFDLAQNVAVTKRDLLALLQETARHQSGHSISPSSNGAAAASASTVSLSSALPPDPAGRAIGHLLAFDAAGRRFATFSQLLHAVILAEADGVERARLRSEIRAYLNSDACTLFRRPGVPVEDIPYVTEDDMEKLCHASDNQLAMPPVEAPYAPVHVGIPEALVPHLLQQLESRSLAAAAASAYSVGGGSSTVWLNSFEALMKALRQEKRRVATLMAEHVRREAFAPEASSSSSDDPPAIPLSLSSIGELPSGDLYDTDMLRVFVETNCGPDLTRHFRTLANEGDDGTTVVFPTVTHLIDRLKQLHAYWASRRRAVLEYLSSSKCALFSESTRDIVLSLGDVDRLLTEGHAEPDTVQFLQVFDACGRHFASFDDLLASLRQTTALVAERNRTAKASLREYLDRSGLLVPSTSVQPPQDDDLDRLLDAGGAGGSTIHHLEQLERAGGKYTMGELILTVRDCQTKAIDTKRAIWAHVHSSSSRILGPLAAQRREAIAQAKAAALEEARAAAATASSRTGRNMRKTGRAPVGATAAGGGSADLSSTSSSLFKKLPTPNVTLADQALVASTAADAILSEGDLAQPSEEEEAKRREEEEALAKEAEADPLLSISDPITSNASASLSPHLSLPSAILAPAEVDALFSSSRAGPDTPVFLAGLEAAGLSFDSLGALIERVQQEQLDAQEFRSVARRCLLHFLSSGACQLFAGPLELRRVHLDQLLSAAGGSLPYALAHLLRANRKVSLELRQFETFASLVHDVLVQHRACVQQREEIYAFLSAPDCALWSSSDVTLFHRPATTPGDQPILDASRVQVTRAGVSRLWLEGLAGPETLIYLRRLQLRAKDQLRLKEEKALIIAAGKEVVAPIAGSSAAVAAEFRPFDNILGLIAEVRSQHARLLGQQMRLLRFFNAPPGAPPTVSLDGAEADASLWSGIGSGDGAESTSTSSSSSTGDATASVYDLVESHGRDLAPVKVKEVEKLSETCRTSLADLHAHLVAMCREHAEVLAQHSASRLGGQHQPPRRPFQSMAGLTAALAKRIANVATQAKARRKALVDPILAFLASEYTGFVRSTSHADYKPPVYEEADVLALMDQSGAHHETLAMLREVDASGLHTPRKQSLIDAVRDQHARLNEAREMIQQHLTSPYCELFLVAAHTRIPVTWLFPADVDRLLMETFAHADDGGVGGGRRSQYNYNALHYITLLEQRKVDIGSWAFLITSLKQLDGELLSHLTWEQQLVGSVLGAHAKQLFASSNFALSPVHLNKLIAICDGRGATAAFLLHHSFVLPRQEHRPFGSFVELCEGLERQMDKALGVQREALDWLRKSTLLPTPQPPASNTGESVMSPDGFVTISASSSATPQHAFDGLVAPKVAATALTLAQMETLFVASAAGFELLGFLTSFSLARRSFPGLYELIAEIRAAVRETEKSEVELYEFFHPTTTASPSSPLGASSASKAQYEPCTLFDYAPTKVIVTHADCTRLLLQTEAGSNALRFVRQLNGFDETLVASGVDQPTPHHFDDFPALVHAVREKHLGAIADQARFNASLKANRETLARALERSGLIELTPDLHVGEQHVNQLLDTVLAAGSGKPFDQAHWESQALAGGREEVLQALATNVTVDPLSIPASDRFHLTGSAAVHKVTQLLLLMREAQWRFHSIQDFVPVLRMEYERNERTVREVRAWLQSDNCRLFVEESANKPSGGEASSSADRHQQQAKPKQHLTLAHSLTMSDVDLSLFEKGEYYAPGNAPAHAIEDLKRLQGNILRNAKAGPTSATGGQSGKHADATASPVALGGPRAAGVSLGASFNLASLSTFRSLDSLARALNIVHKDRAAQVALQEQQVVEFILAPANHLLRTDVEHAVRRSHVRSVIESSPTGKPLLHLQFLALTRAQFDSPDQLIAGVRQCQLERTRMQGQLIELLQMPTATNLVFARMPPADLVSAKHLDAELMEKLMTDSLAERRTLAYIQMMIKRAAESAVAASIAAASPAGKKVAARPTVPVAPAPASLSFHTFHSLLAAVSRFHLDYTATLAREQIKLLAWLTGQSCRLFETAREPIHFSEPELELFFLPLPTSEVADGVPPEAAALTVLKQMDAEGKRFLSLKACVVEAHRTHGRTLATRRALKEFFSPRANPNGGIFRESPMGRVHVGEHEVELLWRSAGALTLRYIFHFEFIGRRFATVEELAAEVAELHRQSTERDDADRADLLAYLIGQAQDIPGGVFFDLGSVARLLTASQASAALTRTYLEYLDELGEGVAPPSGVPQAEDVVSRLEQRLRVLARDAHDQKREVFLTLTSPECHLFAYAPRGEDVLPSFAKIDALWVRGGAGLQTLPLIRTFMARSQHARFESFERLALELRRETMLEKERRVELAAWIARDACELFAHVHPRPTYHASEMQALLPERDYSPDALIGGDLDAAGLDTLSLLKSLTSDPALRPRFLGQFASSRALATVFQPLQRATVRAFRVVVAFLGDPAQCRFFSSRAYGVPVSFVEARRLVEVVRSVDPQADALAAARELLLHLWALEVASRRFTDWDELCASVRVVAQLARSYPVRGRSSSSSSSSSSFPSLSPALFSHLFGSYHPEDAFAITVYESGLLSTQVGVILPGAPPIEERRAKWFRQQMRERIEKEASTREFFNDSATKGDEQEEEKKSMESHPQGSAGASASGATNSSASGVVDLPALKQAVYSYLWSPACTLLLVGADLATTGTVDSLFAVCGTHATLVMQYLQQMQALGCTFHTTAELIVELEKVHLDFLEIVEENLILTTGQQQQQPQPQQLDPSATLSAIHAAAEASFQRRSSGQFNPTTATPMRSPRGDGIGVDDRFPLHSSALLAAGGSNPSNSSKLAAASVLGSPSAASASQSPQYDEDTDFASSSPASPTGAHISFADPSEGEVATARQMVASKHAALEWLGSGRCALLPLTTAITEAEIARIFTEGGAGLKTRALLEELEQAHENFTRIDDLVAAVRQTHEAALHSKATILAILNSPRCCLLPDPPKEVLAAHGTTDTVPRVTPRDVSHLIASGGAGNTRTVALLKVLQEEHLQARTHMAAFHDRAHLARAINRLFKQELVTQHAVLQFARSKACVLFRGLASVAAGKIRPSDALRLMYETNALEATPTLLEELNAEFAAEVAEAERSSSSSSSAKATLLKQYRHLEDVIVAIDRKYASRLAMHTAAQANALADHLQTSSLFSYNLVERPGVVGRKVLTPSEQAAVDAAEVERALHSDSELVAEPKPEIGWRYSPAEVLPLLRMYASSFHPYSDPSTWCETLRARVQQDPTCTQRVSAQAIIVALAALENEGFVAANLADLCLAFQQYCQADLVRRAELFSMLGAYASSLFGPDDVGACGPILARDVPGLLAAACGSTAELRANLPLLVSARGRPVFASWASLQQALRGQRTESLKRRARSAILSHLSDPQCRLFAGTVVHSFDDAEIDQLSLAAHAPRKHAHETTSRSDAVDDGVDARDSGVSLGETGSVTRLYLSYLQARHQAFETIQEIAQAIKLIRDIM